MTECTRLSDRMVAVTHGREEWSADEAAHLAACPDCGAEWRVVRAGAQVGTEVARALPADFLATRIVATVQAQRRAKGWVRRLRWLLPPLAAAAALALLVRPGVRPGMPLVPDGPVLEVSVLPELETLDETGLESVLELLPSADVPLEIRSFDELSDDEITGLLNSLEG